MLVFSIARAFLPAFVPPTYKFTCLTKLCFDALQSKALMPLQIEDLMPRRGKALQSSALYASLRGARGHQGQSLTKLCFDAS